MKHNPSRYFMPHVALIDRMLWQNVHCLSYEGWHQQTGTNGGVGAGGKADSLMFQSGLKRCSFGRGGYIASLA